MLVDIEYRESYRGRKKRVCRLRCDTCDKEFERNFSKRIVDTTTRHACSRTCSSRLISCEGPLYEQRKKRVESTNMQRYGKKHAMMTDEFKQKRKETCIERYGHATPLASPVLREKGRQRMLSEFGVTHSMQLETTRKKLEETMLNRYGERNAFQVESIKQKARDTCIKNFGVENPMQASEVQQKARDTCMKNFGVPYPMQSSEVVAKFDWKKRQEKIHKSMKENSSYAKSNAEDSLFEVLQYFFGDSVKRHAQVNGWCIDFYISCINAYIQYDGVYWHGLDRPINEICQFKNPRDETIYKTWLRDKRQNEWFSDNDIILLRFTDQEDIFDIVAKIVLTFDIDVTQLTSRHSD